MPPAMRSWAVLLVLAACGKPFDGSRSGACSRPQEAAWNRGDLEAHMAGYLHSDAPIFISGGKIRRGWQDTCDHDHTSVDAP